MTADAVGLLNVTLKELSGSTVVSPVTRTVIVFEVSPGAKVIVPDGNEPPKSAESAGFVVPPVTA